MSHIYKTFDKTYSTKNWDLRLKFKYIADYLGNFEFDLKCISVGEIESGYEDDDLLTFYPNVLKLGFTDVNRYNYEYLRQVCESYPDLENWEVTQFELWYNNKYETSKRMFLGTVDKKTLRYTDKSRTLEFDIIDIMQNLKNLTCDTISTESGFGQLYNPVCRYIYTAFHAIYSDLNYTITNDINTFKQPDFKGIYFKHNWKFQKFGTNDWYDFETDHDLINIQNPARNHAELYLETYPFKKENYAEMLKAIAFQFGMSIGCEEPNKIFAYKRFVSREFAESQAIDILPYLLNDYTKELWLPNVICVENVFTWAEPWSGGDGGTETIHAGTWRPNESDSTKPKNTDSVYTITTDISSGSRSADESYIWLHTLHPNHLYEVITQIRDDDINMTSYLEYIIAYLYLKARERSKDKYEFELKGTDYSMADYYKIKQDGYSTKILRPMTLKKDLINKKTKLTALEIGMN
jgi:hypothetical protein